MVAYRHTLLGWAFCILAVRSLNVGNEVSIVEEEKTITVLQLIEDRPFSKLGIVPLASYPSMTVGYDAAVLYSTHPAP